MSTFIGGVEWESEGKDVIAMPIPADPKLARLAEWWHRLAHVDLEGLLPKAVEYSAHDLELTGIVMAELMTDNPGPGEVAGAELTCLFYLMSKVMRAIGAVKEGREPSEDTIRDIRIYATMIQRIRDKGSWPGLNVNEIGVEE